MSPVEFKAQRLHDWIANKGLPFWSEQGLDRTYGGFIEAFEFSGQDSELPYKRTRVTCRNIYVFAHAHVLKFADYKDIITQGTDFLVSKAWQNDQKGFARRVSRQGEVIDPTPDLYDYAFVLFAFAWAYRAVPDTTYRDWIHKTLDAIETQLRHPSGFGFWHEVPPKGDRLQNPHMHLLEASLVAYEATEEDRLKDYALKLAHLFKEYFFNRHNGTLAEYFKDDWSRADGEKGRIAEPGHQLEWAWILQNCQRLLGLKFHDEIEALIGFAEKHGINQKTGAVMNVVRDDGTPIDMGSRTWPNTERLKAAVALCDLNKPDPAVPMIRSSASLLLDTYLSSSPGITIPRGTWIDAFDGDGKPVAERIPASTLYHVFLAFAEVLRVNKQYNLSL